MSDKFKKRVREHAEKHGMSYQTARQQLEAADRKRTEGKVPRFALRKDDPLRVTFDAMLDQAAMTEDDYLRAWALDVLVAWKQQEPEAVAALPKFKMMPTAIRPLTSSTLADVITGFDDNSWPHILLVPPDEFTDMMKFVTGEHVAWKGSDLWVWGVRVYREPEMPEGCIAAVTADQQMLVRLTLE